LRRIGNLEIQFIWKTAAMPHGQGAKLFVKVFRNRLINGRIEKESGLFTWRNWMPLIWRTSHFNLIIFLKRLGEKEFSILYLHT